MGLEAMTPDELAAYDGETVRQIVEFEKRVRASDAEYEELKTAASAAKKMAEAKADELRQLIREREERRGKRPEKTLLDLVPKTAAWRERPIAHLEIPESLRAFLWANSVQTVGEIHQQVTGFDPSQGTPFGMPLDDVFTLKSACQAMIDAEDADGAESSAVPPELWRDFPIARWSEYGLTSKDIEKLAAGQLKDGGAFPIVTVGDLSRFSEPAASGYTRRLIDVKGIGPAGVDRISESESLFWAGWRGGLEQEFARERGHGVEAPAGPGSEDTGSGNVHGEAGGPAQTQAEEEPAVAF